jgi:uncharacterized membrane protein (GlpM family)
MPQFNAEEIGAHRMRDYIIRFCFGAAISLVAGLVGMKFGPRLGGVFLAFPAILPASLTLIAKKEGDDRAAGDSIGAVLGAIAMIAFAVIVSLWVVRLGVVLALAIALAVWLVVAVALYGLVEAAYGREPSPP